MARLNCVILAAGKGTRMVSKVPKILHPIMGKPMVHYVVETARKLQTDRVIAVIGHEREMVESHLRDEAVMVAVQADQKGTAHAVLSTEGLLGEGDILVLYGDVPLIKAETLEGFWEYFLKSEGIAFMTTEVSLPEGYGRVVLEGDDILDIVEDSEATGAVREINVINTGICMIRKDLLHLVKSVTPDNRKGEYYLTDVCKTARKRGIKVKAYHHPNAGEVLGINTRKDLLEANLLMKNAILERHMENGVTIADRSVYIESDVAIGKDTVILPSCCITGKTEIGEYVTIGPHVVINDSRIGSAVTIKEFASLNGVRVEDGVVIGPLSQVKPGTHLKKAR